MEVFKPVDRICPKCGNPDLANVAGGVCPRCLLEETLITMSTDGDEETENVDVRGPGEIGDYVLLEEIARGGMGIVYRARQVSLHRIVAVKLLPAGSLAREDRVARFQVEAAAAAALRHPHIVAIHEIGEHEGQWYFSMDYVDGQSLADMARGRPLVAKKAAEWMKSIAEAVHYAHTQGVLHRDLKPANILIDALDQPRITDFGLAKRLGAAETSGGWDSDLALTGTGELVGTPSFMSPEQASANRRAVDVTSDVYSLGAVLYYLLTGRPPFQAESLLDTLEQVRDSDPIRPRRLNRSVPSDLETVCLKCLEKAPANRYRSAEALARDLGRFLEHKPIEARACGPLVKCARWCRRQPALSAALGLCLALVTAGVVQAIREWREAERFAEYQRSLLYAEGMKLADVALSEEHFRRVRTILDRHVPEPGQRDLRGFEWWYLWHQSREEQVDRFRPQDSLTVAMSVTPDGKLLGTASYEGMVGVWRLPGRESVTNFSVESQGPRRNGLEFSTDGSMLAVHEGDRVRLWRTGDWSELEGPTGGAWMAPQKDSRPVGFMDGDRVLVAKFQDEVVVWDIAKCAVRNRLRGAEGDLGFLMVPIGNGAIAALATQNSVEIWDVLEGRRLHQLDPLLDGPNALAYCPVNGWLACGDRRGAVVVWDGSGGALGSDVGGKSARLAAGGIPPRLVGVVYTRNAAVYALRFSRDGKYIVAGGREQVIRAWKLDALGETVELRGQVKSIRALCFLMDGSKLVSSDTSNDLRFWEFPPTEGGLAEETPKGVATAESDTVDAGGGPFASVTLGRTQGNVPSGTGSGGLVTYGGWELPLVFTTDRRFLVAVTREMGLGVYDRFSGELKRGMKLALSGRPTCCAASPGGRWFAYPDASGVVRLCEVDGLRVRSGFEWPRPRLQGIGFTPDERSMLLVNLGGCEVWDTESGKLQFEWKHRLGPGFDFSPDGRWLAIVDRQVDDTMCTVSILDWRIGQVVRNLRGHLSTVKAIAFSPDHRHLATASWDETIRLWDLSQPDGSGDQLLFGHKEPVTALAFTHDGRTLASSAQDRTIRLWSVAHGQEMAKLNTAVEQSMPLVFSRDDEILAAGTGWVEPQARGGRFFHAPRP